MDADPDLWVLVIRPLPDGTPAAVRVRQLLKRALRDWRLKCVAVRDVATAAEREAAGRMEGQ